MKLQNFDFQMILALLGILLVSPNILGQEIVASQGGEVVVENVIYVFTVGEPIIETLTNSKVILSQGFNQPKKLFVSTKEATSRFQLKAYPNPTSDLLTVVYANADIKFSLYESTGRMIPIIMSKFSDQKIDISFANLSAGLYLLRAISPSGETISFVQIVKQ